MGMLQCYGKFIPNLSAIAAPLNELRKKGVKRSCEKPQIERFREIKHQLAEAVLTHHDLQIPVVLATDASEYRLGAVVHHKMLDRKQKIADGSRTLTKGERNYAQIEKQALNTVCGVDKFNQFLYRRKSRLLTGHQRLVKIFW